MFEKGIGGTAICILLTVVSKEGNSLEINFLHEKKISAPPKIMTNRKINFFILTFKDRVKRNDST